MNIDFEVATPEIKATIQYDFEEQVEKCREIFQRLSAVDISGEVQKKQGLTYLPWAAAERILMTEYPGFVRHIYWFNNGGRWYPYFSDETGYMVKVGLTIEGIHKAEMLPVWDGRPPKSTENPTSMDINTALKRCGVKAAALWGLGLNIFIGEDLIERTQINTSSPPQPPYTGAKKKLRMISKEQQEEIEYLLAEQGIASLTKFAELHEDWSGFTHALGKKSKKQIPTDIKSFSQPQQEWYFRQVQDLAAYSEEMAAWLIDKLKVFH